MSPNKLAAAAATRSMNDNKSAGDKDSAICDNRFALLAKLISSPDKLTEEAVLFQQLEKLIHTDFLKLCARIGIPGESALFNELVLTLSDLRDLIEFPYLANKNILAVGGGFSSGKSKFLNSIMGVDQLLPEGLTPTTAIPTYLTSAPLEEIKVLNTFNRIQKIDRLDLNAISHAFNEGKNAKSGTISFYHILKLIQIKSPGLKWNNIALLDTPGYSSPHSGGENEKTGIDAGNTDEEKAREHLSQADHLIWVISAADGTFQQSDINFLLEKVKWNDSLYILVNKADQKTIGDVSKIFDRIRVDAENAGFNVRGMSAYSSRSGEVYLGDDPRSWFEAIDQKCKYTRWRGRFKAVFEKIIRFNSEEEDRSQMLKKSLDPIYLKGDDILTREQMVRLKETMRVIDEDRKTHSAATRQFTAFSEKVERILGEVLDKIGVADENASAVGIAGRWSAGRVAGNKGLTAFQSGNVFEGKVDSLSKLGCFVSSGKFKDQIRIRYQEIESKYAAPEVFFGKGKPVVLTVYEIDLTENAVIFTVEPKHE